MTDTQIIDTDSQKKKWLEDFLVDNPALEKLEGLLDQFNIFEAIGAVRQEVRHSDFLAFLLNPNQNHGLRDIFVKRLLQKAISNSNQLLDITPIDLDLWDLDDIEVRREWQSIDIMLIDETNKLVVVIENKIDSIEHDNQLQKYNQIARLQFPAYKRICLYLSPEGQEPSDSQYVTIDYSLICQLLEDIVASRQTILGQDVLTIIKHYLQILRRHIVGESEIEKLCQKIYRKHQRALDMIYEYKPDQLAEIQDYLISLIKMTPDMEFDHASKSAIHFIPKKWDVSELQQGQGWTSSKRILLFEFSNYPESLKLYLILGPGPDETRQKVFDFISQHEPPFNRSFKNMNKKWSTIYKHTILSKNNYVDKDMDEIKNEINHRWLEFLDHEYKKMDVILSPYLNPGNK